MERGNRPEEIAEVQAELAECEAQLEQLKAQRDCAKELLPKRAISQQDYEVADSQYWAMFRRVERLRFALKLMKDGPRIERIDNRPGRAPADARPTWPRTSGGWTTARSAAPVSGTILKKNAEEGNVVNPIAFNGSFSLCEMADLSDLEVDLSIQERDVARVFKGQKCKICAEAFPGSDLRGLRIAADAHCRPGQGGSAGAGEGLGAGR